MAVKRRLYTMRRIDFRVRLAQLEMNQTELAEKLDVNASHLSRMIGGSPVLRRTARDIAAALGKGIEELFDAVTGASEAA